MCVTNKSSTPFFGVFFIGIINHKINSYLCTNTYSKISKGSDTYMAKASYINDTLRKNREHFHNELKMYVNQRLFEKNIISEDMYRTVKEVLLKKAS